MSWSVRIGCFAGIEFFLHWTFLVLFGVLGLASTFTHPGPLGPMLGLATAFSIGLCVALRELGCTVAAAHYGNRISEITLLPIGGVPHPERMLNDRKQQLRVGIAGGAVNLAIIAVLFGLRSALEGSNTSQWLSEAGDRLLSDLIWVNIGLAALSFLPVSPMEGGRVLRSMLAARLDPAEAAEFTAALGRATAIAIGMIGLIFNWYLLLAAVFMYFGAALESRESESVSLDDVEASSVMSRRFHVLSRDDTLQTAANEWRTTLQSDFPVVDHGKVVGILACGRLAEAMARTGPKGRVGAVMEREWPVVEDTEPLEAALQKLQANSHSSLPVTHDGRLVGVITKQEVARWVDSHRDFRGFKPPLNLAQPSQIQRRPQQDW